MALEDEDDLAGSIGGFEDDGPWPEIRAPQMPVFWVPASVPPWQRGDDDADVGQQPQQHSMAYATGYQPMMWMPPDGEQALFGSPTQQQQCGRMNYQDAAPRRTGGASVGLIEQKQRFCSTYPNVSRCRHGARCAFAHQREEVQAPLLSPEEETREPAALTEDFFMQRFKTLWCPIGTQHDWQLCMYAHTYQDVRRPPSIGYGHQLCPYWSKKETTLAYSQRCPLGPRCAYAHGAKEQLYHPSYFRTLVCRDLQRRKCPRRQLCAFFHKKSECRPAPRDNVDYGKPLRKEQLPQDWLAYFLSPPHFQEVPAEGMDNQGEVAAAPFWGCRSASTAAAKDDAAERMRMQGPLGRNAESEEDDFASAWRPETMAVPMDYAARGYGAGGKGGKNGKKQGLDGMWGAVGGVDGPMHGGFMGAEQWGGMPFLMPCSNNTFPGPELYEE